MATAESLYTPEVFPDKDLSGQELHETAKTLAEELRVALTHNDAYVNTVREQYKPQISIIADPESFTLEPLNPDMSLANNFGQIVTFTHGPKQYRVMTRHMSHTTHADGHYSVDTSPSGVKWTNIEISDLSGNPEKEIRIMSTPDSKASYLEGTIGVYETSERSHKLVAWNSKDAAGQIRDVISDLSIAYL